MSQDHVDDDTLDDDAANDEQGNLPHMRKLAKAGEKAIADNLDLRKQLAFYRAGINIDGSRVAKMLYETWKGDVENIDALKAEAVELGLLEGNAPPPAAELDPTRVAEDQRRAALQESLSSGTPAGATPTETPHPRHKAMEEFQRDVREGKDEKAARADAFAKVISAAAAGDKRVFWDRDQHFRDAAEADRAAGRPLGV